MIQNRFHFNMALLMALLLHGSLIFWVRLPAEKVLSSPPPPLRLSLQAPVVETEVASEPAPSISAPLPQKVSPRPPLEWEVLPESIPEPLLVIPPPPPLPEPSVIVAEIPVIPPEIAVVPEEVVPEVLTQELPIVPPEPLPELLPEPEVLEAVDLPEPPMDFAPDSEVTMPEAPVLLAEMPMPEALPESEILPQEHVSESAPEALSEPSIPEPVAELSLPEIETSEVSTNQDVPAQNAEAVAAYQKRLTAWLEKHKYYPRRARRLRIEGEGWLRIRIDRAGRAQEIQLERTSGNRLLDRAALEIARRADPFPPLPQSDSRQELEFIVPVSFVLR